MMREPGEVENDIFDIFANMASSDEQFPVTAVMSTCVFLFVDLPSRLIYGV